MKYILILSASLLLLALVTSPTAVKAQSDVKFVQPEKIYLQAEQMPEFLGGHQALLKFLDNNVKYPEAAKKEELEGMTVISFIVEKNGNISHLEIKKSAGVALDQEALRVIKLTSGKWKAGKQDGETVKVKLTAPVLFSASED